MKTQNNLNKKIGIFLIGIIFLLGAGVYAVVPNPGHSGNNIDLTTEFCNLITGQECGNVNDGVHNLASMRTTVGNDYHNLGGTDKILTESEVNNILSGLGFLRADQVVSNPNNPPGKNIPGEPTKKEIELIAIAADKDTYGKMRCEANQTLIMDPNYYDSLGYHEECDDGNNIDGDGCSADCKIETNGYCGDGVTDPGEECDNGFSLNNHGNICSKICTVKGGGGYGGTYCGDGDKNQAWEQCDDRNNVNGDGCSMHCKKETKGYCGDGYLTRAKKWNCINKMGDSGNCAWTAEKAIKCPPGYFVKEFDATNQKLYCCGSAVAQDKNTFISDKLIKTGTCNIQCNPGECGAKSGDKLCIRKTIQKDYTVTYSELLEPCYSAITDCLTFCASCSYGYECEENQCVKKSGSSIGGGKVLCTEAHRQGYISDEIYRADAEYAEKYIDEATMLGYHSWAKPLVKKLATSPKIAETVIPLSVEWAKHMAFIMGTTKEDSEIGKILNEVGMPLCKELGEKMIQDGYTEENEYLFDSYIVKEIVNSNLESLSINQSKKEFQKSLENFLYEFEKAYTQNNRFIL